MALEQVRFIHSGDWHLELPVAGASTVPPELRDALVEAPYQAAERVVQASLEQGVDFLLLTGNLLPIETACPYSLEFLRQQFQRLSERGIAVYWLGAETDDVDLWPAELRLPDNVHWFPVGRLHKFDHQRDGKTVVGLMGQSGRQARKWSASDFAGRDDTLPRLAVANGKPPKRSLENQGIDYWALGGQARHHVVLHGATTAVYAGSPQGRGPDDTDAHGVVLVELQYGKATLQLLETDVWRWRRERVQAAGVVTIEELEAQLERQLQQIPGDTSRFGYLLIWSVVCHGPLAWRLQPPAVQHRLLESLQQCTHRQGRWSVLLETEPAELPAEWSDEDTVLGDFLRAVQRYEQDGDAWQELATLLPEGTPREQLLVELKQVSGDDRQRLWRRVASWGAALLRGELALEESGSRPT
jgi:DNA repair exonuclease SbcCD nuclease subunit